MTTSRKILTAAVAALSLSGAFALSAAPAQAQSFSVSISGHHFSVRQHRPRPDYRPVHYAYAPDCYFAPNRRVDAYGNIYFRRVRVCG